MEVHARSSKFSRFRLPPENFEEWTDNRPRASLRKVSKQVSVVGRFDEPLQKPGLDQAGSGKAHRAAPACSCPGLGPQTPPASRLRHPPGKSLPRNSRTAPIRQPRRHADARCQNSGFGRVVGSPREQSPQFRRRPRAPSCIPVLSPSWRPCSARDSLTPAKGFSSVQS